MTLWNVHDYEHKTNNICEGMTILSVSVDFHYRLNRRIKRTHSNIRSFIRCLMSEKSRCQHRLIQLTTGAQRRPEATPVDSFPKRVDVLNQHYYEKQIDAEDLLHGLSLIITRKR